jgi:hypothetical protein
MLRSLALQLIFPMGAHVFKNNGSLAPLHIAGPLQMVWKQSFDAGATSLLCASVTLCQMPKHEVEKRAILNQASIGWLVLSTSLCP